MNKVTMLNGLPITELNGLGCNCQNKPLGNLQENILAPLLVAGTCIGIAYLGHEPKKQKALNGVGTEILKDSVGKLVMVGGGVAAIYFLIARPLLQKVGVVDTKEDRQASELATSANSPFNPNYYKTRTGPLITKDQAKAYAKLIWDAKGTFNDNEEQVYGTLRRLTHKMQLSWLADVFNQLYNRDLYSFIRDFMSDDEMAIVHGIANNLK